MTMTLSSLSLLCLAYSGALVLVRLLWLGFRGYTGPLRSVPGPWYARLSNWRLKWAVLSGCRVHYIHSLHRRYGPIVRISPVEVAICDAPSYREIYRIGSGFNKTDWYLGYGENEKNVLSIFNMADPKTHAARRRLLAKGFHHRLLREHWEPVVKERILLAVRRMKDEAASTATGTVDVLKWWAFMTTDIASALFFGESFHMLELGYRVPFVDALQKSLIQVTLFWELPLLYRLLKMLNLAATRPIFDATEILQEQGSQAVREIRQRGVDPHSMFATMVEESEKEDESSRLSDDDLRVEAGNLIVAGSDTTASTLTYLTWAVLRQPKLHRDLVAELNGTESLCDETLERLPVLNAAVDETLRLYGAVPSTLPRRTPSGGITLHGHYIPEGTIVGTQTYSLHRNPAAFPDPDRFDHTRFLPSSTEGPAAIAKASFSPFSAGSANCIGVSLARMELRMAAALFFTECGSARLASGTTDDCMEMENFFIVVPRGHRCEVIL